MLFAALKAAISGLLVALISETAKRSPALGALIASLPVISILGMIWLWHETKDAPRIAAHAEATFWYVLPSLPMFLVLPALLRSGMHFYPALGLCCVLTAALYLAMVWVLKFFGITL
ncbi:MAG: hypothetical protein GC136_02945 [Alphaproteobacteria bacterium]|nr:hypothetical protein [Alphaproteobacteria bacterium]